MVRREVMLGALLAVACTQKVVGPDGGSEGGAIALPSLRDDVPAPADPARLAAAKKRGPASALVPQGLELSDRLEVLRAPSCSLHPDEGVETAAAARVPEG